MAPTAYPRCERHEVTTRRQARTIPPYGTTNRSTRVVSRAGAKMKESVVDALQVASANDIGQRASGRLQNLLLAGGLR